MKKCQAIFEAALCFAFIFLFMLGIVKIMLWGNAQIVNKTLTYNKYRTQAGSPGQQLLWPMYENRELKVDF